MYCKDLIERNLYYAIKDFAEGKGIRYCDVLVTDMIDMFTYELTFQKGGEEYTTTILI